jgi:hypothetical protein
MGSGIHILISPRRYGKQTTLVPKGTFGRRRSDKKIYLKQIGAVLKPRVMVTSHPNEENEGNGDEEGGDDDESDTESYDDYDSEDDDYNYRDVEDVSEESDEISESDNDIE